LRPYKISNEQILTFSWPAGRICPTYKCTLQIRWDAWVPLLFHAAMYCKLPNIINLVIKGLKSTKWTEIMGTLSKWTQENNVSLEGGGGGGGDWLCLWKKKIKVFNI
jgi:hypothetical protein